MKAERTALIVRHAKAGDRLPDDRGEWGRGLSSPGRAQAQALCDLLSAFPIAAVLSSPLRRCRETVEPLARAVGLEVQTAGELAEGSGLDGLLRLLSSLDATSVLSSHGDVIGNLVGELVELGLIEPSEALCAKASTWVLGLEGVYIRSALYLPPPR